ncbi:MAG: hypothetical protein GY774_11000 [Planctomycetes bacterium]|nr:hypothetical protein [Planctomycetota bacterium]
MTDHTLNTKSITSIRPVLQKKLFPLIQYMHQLGWDVTINLPHDKSPGNVSFNKHSEWHNRPTLACKCSFGYQLEKSDEEHITSIAQRSAELCLSVYEAFPSLIPDTPNIHGDIKPGSIINLEKYRKETYKSFVERHADKKLKVTALHYDTVLITFYNARYLIGSEETQTVKQDLDLVIKVLRGDIAFSC